MPIEIMELVIRAKVSETDASSSNNSNESAGQVGAAALAPIQKAVKEIMNIIKRKNER